MTVAMPTARRIGARRVVLLSLAALLLRACQSTEEPRAEPETWRRYVAVGFDTSALPRLIWAVGADTGYVAGAEIQFRDDGMAALFEVFRYYGQLDTVVSVSPYSQTPDSLFWGWIHIGLDDTTLAITRHIPPWGPWRFRLDPSSRLTP